MFGTWLLGAGARCSLLMLVACLDVPVPPGSGGGQFDREWVVAESVSVVVPPLLGPRLAYHESRGRVVLYGGTTSIYPADAQASMYEWDGVSWQMICDECGPGKLVGHSLIYDPSDQRLLLFGGTLPDDSLTSALWQWKDDVWSMVSTTGSGAPPASSDGWMAWDQVRHVVMLFGGLAASGPLDGIFELDGDQWRDIEQPAERPSPRSGGVAAVLGSGEMLIYGGIAGAQLFDDLWEWTGVRWRRLCSACTGVPRRHAGVIFDPARGRIVVTGGYSGVDEIAGTLELSAEGDLVDSDDAPGARGSSGVAYDPDRDVIVLYGGDGCGGNCGETLEYRRVEQADGGL